MKQDKNGEDWEKAVENLKDFDDILELVGSEGRYQKLILYGVATPIVVVFPFLVLQWIFMLSVPDHWCHVPGRPEWMDLADWKNHTLPIEIGPDGHNRFSRCEMYDSNGTNVQCTQWEYDRMNFDETIPTEYNWVCSDSQKVADSFSVPSLGNVIGTIILGVAADKFGRKRTYFASLLLYLTFYYVSIFVVGKFGVFIVLKFLTGMTYNAMFITPCLITAEVSGKNYRAWVYSVLWMAWVLGNCLIPFLASVTRSWTLLGFISASPGALLLLYLFVLQESPRWLISVGRMDEAGKIIKKIAKYNGTCIHPTLLAKALENIKKAEIMRREEANKQECLGVWSLFSRARIAFNTILLCVAWACSSMIYTTLAINTTSMSGNQFWNYFYLGLIELPAGWLGGFLVERVGRRWTQALFFIICSFSFAIASMAVFNPELSWIVLGAALSCKFCVSVTSLVIYLQGAELFPTQLRSTASALASTVSSLACTLAPYFVYLGQYHAAGPYLILTLVATLGMLTSACLPETFRQKLPETMEDAEKFGMHKFWSFLPKDDERKKTDEIISPTVIEIKST